MSDDEGLAFIVAGVMTISGVWSVVVPLFAVKLLRQWWGRWAILAAMIVSFAGLLAVLRTLAAREVRDEWGYILLFMAGGGACVTAAMSMMSFFGIGWRDNALERRNAGAALVTIGTIVGAMLIYTGSNIGEGPTIWTTLMPAGCGLIGWGMVWAIVQGCTGVAESVVVERDAGSAIRLACMLVANGLILGRATAGDWVSEGQMLQSLWGSGWPVLVLGGVAIVTQILYRPRVGVRNPFVSTVALPGGAMLAAAVIWPINLGMWR